MSEAPQTQIEQLRPVWLFFDDLLRLADMLRRRGAVEISTPGRIVRIPEERRPTDISVDEALRQRCEEVYQTRPMRWLCLLVYEMGTWIVLLPRQAQVRHVRDWGPAVLETAWVEEVLDFIKTRYHPLWFLGERGWQLITVLVASVLLLPAMTVSIPQGIVSDILRGLGLLGLLTSAIVAIFALVGIVIPSPSHVTLWRCERRTFSFRVRLIAYCVAGGGGALLLSVILGSRGLLGERTLLSLLGLLILAATACWIFGVWVGRVR